MTNENETAREVIAEMREAAQAGTDPEWVYEIARRLEAALAREAELADDEQWAPRHGKPTSPAPTAPGNAAAMREDAANLSSWDGVDAQIDALKRLARTRVGGHECAMPCAEFADIVERLDAARKRELASPGNAARMREVLGKNTEEAYLLLDILRDEMISAIDAASNVLEESEAALAAPALNCDRYRSIEEAWAAWDGIDASEKTRIGGIYERIGGFEPWLFAKVEGGPHA